MRILNRTPVAPVRLNPEVPSKLERIISKALEKDRNLRYQHASDMRTDLPAPETRYGIRDDGSGSEGEPVASSVAAASPHRRRLAERPPQLRCYGKDASARWPILAAVAVVLVALQSWARGFTLRAGRTPSPTKTPSSSPISPTARAMRSSTTR